jgi:hypothetical protein
MKTSTLQTLTSALLTSLLALILLIAAPAEATAVECVTDAECPVCDVCVNNQCVQTPGAPPMCEDASDCGEDEFCEVVPGAPCQNHCVSKECAVVFCAQECEPYTDPCDDGKVCVETIKGCCGMCEPIAPTCETHADCDVCEGCHFGECIPAGVVECNTDADCGDEQFCQTYGGELACKNHCVDMECNLIDCDSECDPYFSPCGAGETCVEAFTGCCGSCEPITTPCDDNEACGPCAVCHEGECKATGMVICEADADCDDDEVCALHATDPCKNACEATTIEPDVIEGDATAPDSEAPETSDPDTSDPDASDPDTTTPDGDEAETEGPGSTPGSDDSGTDCSFGGFQTGSSATGLWIILLAVSLALSLSRRRCED